MLTRVALRLIESGCIVEPLPAIQSCRQEVLLYTSIPTLCRVLSIAGFVYFVGGES